MISIQPDTRAAYRLMHDGILTLAEIERTGIRIDVEYCKRQIDVLDRRVERLVKVLHDSKDVLEWKQIYKGKFNLDSPRQLADYLYKHKGLIPSKTTEKGNASVDDESLKSLKEPFVQDLLRIRRLKKTRDTYLKGILSEVSEDGLLHPFFNLHTVKSFRSSAQSPNFQNLPIRDKEMGKIIRQAFIPRSGHRFGGVDYAGIEVRISAAYHHDTTMLEYIRNPSSDMHRDMAMECYKLRQDQVNKSSRYCAKNKFVFPQFYGDWYKSCAASLWSAIDEMELQTADGIPIREHLKSQGIQNYNRYESHIKQVEDRFWNDRFPIYAQWKDAWVKEYERTGRVHMHTGFTCSGVMRRNEVINLPIQGCLAGMSRILTNNGWIPIRELVGIRTKVWTGFRWADAIGLARGKCQRAVVYLKSGLIIQCDTRHKLKNEMDEWVSFSNFREGDWTALSTHGELLQPSETMTWWFIFGFIIGDGYLSAKRRSVSITVGRKKFDILLRIRKFLVDRGYKEEGYRSIRWYTIPAHGTRQEKYVLSLQDRQFAQFLETYGFDFQWKAKTKRIPSSVWVASLQDQRDFMEGLWLSDGSRGKWTEKNLNMASDGLLRDVQILSSVLGFDSILTGIHLRFHWRKFNSHSPRMFPHKALLRQVESVRKENYLNSEYCVYVVDSHNFSKARKGKDISQHIAERIIKKNAKNAKIYRYDRIDRIKILPHEEETYTMSVDDSLHQFVADGVLHKNSAFHCLLWSLIRLHDWLKQGKMRSKIVGQIHDEITGDFCAEELDTVLKRAREIMCEEIRQEWEWIVTPLDIESSFAPVDRSWYEKEIVSL